MIRIRLNPNSEDARRAVRVARIIAAIDGQVGAQYGDAAELVANFVEALEYAWEVLGDAAGYNPPRAPGPKTRVLVAELIRARALRVAS
jgi:hypothetical protein